MPTIFELLQGAAGGGEENARPPIRYQVRILESARSRLIGGPNHRVGDWITPRTDSGVVDHYIGQPGILIHVDETQGKNLAMYHVAFVCGCGSGDIIIRSAHHWCWEAWDESKVREPKTPTHEQPGRA